MRVVVGRLGRAHGIRGDLSVEVRTDEPDRRFASGSVLHTDSVVHPTLTVEWMRWHSGRLLVHLVGVDDRNAAEAVRGTTLEVDVVDDELPEGDDEYYDRQLVGLRVEEADGTLVGELTEISHLPAHDMLVVTRADDTEVLIPFITEFVPLVDLAGRRVVVTPPAGLLEDLDALEAPDDADAPEGDQGPEGSV